VIWFDHHGLQSEQCFL